MCVVSQELKEGDAAVLSSDTARGSRSKALWRGHRSPDGHQAPSGHAEQNPISCSPASENPSDSEIRKQTGEDLEFCVVGWPLVSAAQVQRGRNVMRQTRCLLGDRVNLVRWEPDTPSSFLKSHGLPTKPETHVPAGQGTQGQAGHRLPVGNVRI